MTAHPALSVMGICELISPAQRQSWKILTACCSQCSVATNILPSVQCYFARRRQPPSSDGAWQFSLGYMAMMSHVAPVAAYLHVWSVGSCYMLTISQNLQIVFYACYVFLCFTSSASLTASLEPQSFGSVYLKSFSYSEPHPCRTCHVPFHFAFGSSLCLFTQESNRLVLGRGNLVLCTSPLSPGFPDWPLWACLLAKCYLCQKKA